MDVIIIIFPFDKISFFEKCLDILGNAIGGAVIKMVSYFPVSGPDIMLFFIFNNKIKESFLLSCKLCFIHLAIVMCEVCAINEQLTKYTTPFIFPHSQHSISDRWLIL